MTKRVEPVRTCVGCRERAPKSDLLRVVAVEGRLVPDPRGTLPGRGAHLHPRADCLAAAERRRAFGRALRLDRAVDPAPVHAHLAPQDEHHQQDQQDQHAHQRTPEGRTTTMSAR